MNRYTASLLVLFTLLAAQPGAANDVFNHPVSLDTPPETLPRVLNGLQSVPVVRAEFIETRRMHSLNRPLKSEGYMVFAREQGLYRRLMRPVEQEQFVGPDGWIVERYPDGETNRLDLSGRTEGRFVALTFDLFAGELDRLDPTMKVFFDGTSDSWTLGIRPAGEMKQFVRQLVIRGTDRRIRTMQMVHASGDTTVTRFERVSIQDELTSDQKAVFRNVTGE